jgi:hypothetical protein
MTAKKKPKKDDKKKKGKNAESEPRPPGPSMLDPTWTPSKGRSHVLVMLDRLEEESVG